MTKPKKGKRGKPVIIQDTFDPEHPPKLPPDDVEPDLHDLELARQALARHWPPPPKD